MSVAFKLGEVIAEEHTIYELVPAAFRGKEVLVNRWFAAICGNGNDSREIAKSIAHAVNCHADLLAACEAAGDLLHRFGFNFVAEPGEEPTVYEKISAAIAKAKGGAA